MKVVPQVKSVFIPTGTYEINLKLMFSKNKKTNVALYLYDTLKRLRYSFAGNIYEGFKQIVLKNSKDGYIPYGTWTFYVFFRDIEETEDFDFEIETLRIKRDMMWIAGELHTHTKASDGKWSVFDLGNILRDKGVSFFFVTDHNTFGIDEIKTIKGCVAFPGIELTKPGGHILVLDPDPRLNILNINRYIAGIAHPYFPITEKCPDCRYAGKWNLDFVEIWNSDMDEEHWIKYNIKALKVYKSRFVTAHSNKYITPIAGGDIHSEVSFRKWHKVYFLLNKISLEEILNSIVEGLVISVGEDFGKITLKESFENNALFELFDIQNGQYIEKYDHYGHLTAFANFKRNIFAYLDSKMGVRI